MNELEAWFRCLWSGHLWKVEYLKQNGVKMRHCTRCYRREHAPENMQPK